MHTSPGYSPIKKSLVARARQVGRHQHLLKWDHSTATSPALQRSPAQAREVRPPVGWEVCWAVKHTPQGQPRSASWADRPAREQRMEAMTRRYISPSLLCGQKKKQRSKMLEQGDGF